MKTKFTGLQAFEEDNGTTTTGIGGSGDPVSIGSGKTAETVVNQASTEIKNPDALLKAFESTKAELKELKDFKRKTEENLTAAETKRLEEKGQYEALIPIKVKEAVESVNQLLQAETKKVEKLTKDKAELETRFDSLQKEYKGEKLKTLVNQTFLDSEIKGDPEALDLFWSAYGSKFDLSNDGKPVVSGSDKSLSDYIGELKKTPVGSRLFLADIPEGSGTNPQSGSSKGSGGDNKPRVVTAAEAMNPKKAGFTLEDVRDGKVVIKG